MATYHQSVYPQLTGKVEGAIIAAVMDTFKDNRNFDVTDVTGSSTDPLSHLKTNHIGGVGELNKAGKPALFVLMDENGGISTYEYCQPNVYHPLDLLSKLPKAREVKGVFKIDFDASGGAAFAKYKYDVGVSGEPNDGLITTMYLITVKGALPNESEDTNADVASCAIRMGSYFLQAPVLDAQERKCGPVERGSATGYTNDFFFLFKYMLYQLLKKDSKFKHWLTDMSEYSVQIMQNNIPDNVIDSVNQTLADSIDNLVSLAHRAVGNETVTCRLNRNGTGDQIHITYHPLIIWSLLASALQSDKMPEIAQRQSYVVDSIVTTTTSCSSQPKSSMYGFGYTMSGPIIELPAGMCNTGFRGF
jgi:hypothetical protein